MKKKCLLTLVSAFALTLASCDVWYIKDNGKEVIVKLGDGTTYTADTLFDEYTGTAAGAAEYYTAVYNVLVRIVQPKTTAINNAVAQSMDSFTESAKTTATNDGILYSTALSNALDDKGVDELDELEELYYLDEQKTAYEETYYDDTLTTSLLNEYIDYYAPYHIRHILVKTSADGSLYDGKISETDAKNLSSLVKRLASGNESFGVIAQTTAANGDSGSAAIWGDVGIMSTTTSFVSEFKYGVYQYDKYFNTDTSIYDKIEAFDARQETRTIGSGATEVKAEGAELIPTSAEEASYSDGEKILNNADTVNLIPYNVFVKLGDVASVQLNESGYTEYDGKESYYPRNYLFNKYLNSHTIGFITKGEATDVDDSRFVNIRGVDDKVLADENGNPIIVTRAGSGYQGLHFIIVQKSAFDDNIADYYSTTVPTTSQDVSNMDTYVTFLKSDRSTYNSRAQTIKDDVKGFDANIAYRIYEKALEEAKQKDSQLKIKDSIQKSITNYVTANREQTAYSAKETYEDSWDSYIKLLQVQKKLEKQRICNKLESNSQELTKYYTAFAVSGLDNIK